MTAHHTPTWSALPSPRPAPTWDGEWIEAASDRVRLLLPDLALHATASQSALALAYVEHFALDVPQLDRERAYLQVALARAERDADSTSVRRLVAGMASLADRMPVAVAERMLRLGIAACQQSQDLHLLSRLLNRLGCVLFASGQFVVGRRAWYASLELAREATSRATSGLWEPLTTFAVVTDVLGDRATAAAWLHRLLREPTDVTNEAIAVAHFACAFYARAHHDVASAHEHLAECLRLLAREPLRVHATPARQVFLLAAQAERDRTTGQFARSQQATETAFGLAHATGDAYTAAALLVDQAYFALAHGHLTDARETYRRLRGAARQPHERRSLYARACRFFEVSLPDDAPPAHPTAEGRQTFSVPVQPLPSAHVEPLSRRELEVLHLVAAGLANAAIAAYLVVAPSTVKKHLEHTYSKLDVRSRTAAVARARELRLLD